MYWQAGGLPPGRGSAELGGHRRWTLRTGVKWRSCPDGPLEAGCLEHNAAILRISYAFRPSK